MLDRFILIQFYLNSTRKNLTTSQRDVFATSLQQACRQVVTMLLGQKKYVGFRFPDPT
jgi:uncharacterized SAM-dependent methyltransferase